MFQIIFSNLLFPDKFRLLNTSDEVYDSLSRDEAFVKLTEQNLVAHQTDTEDLERPNPVRSVTSKLIATQLNFISKSYRYEYNEIKRLNNLKSDKKRYENEDLQNITICKKIDQHFEGLPISLHLDSDIVKFATDDHNYEELSNEAKIRLCIARIEVLHLQLQMERDDLNKAKTKAPSAIRDIVCAICLEELQPTKRTIALFCGHVYCADCLDKNTTNTCALCTMRNINLQSLDLRLRFNLDYQPVCRFCLIPFTEHNQIVCLKCGHVYCTTCTHRLDGVCFCGISINSFDQMFTLYPTFN